MARRILAFVLAILLIVPMVVACDKGGDGPEETIPPASSSGNNSEEQNPEATPGETKEDLGIPDDLNFGEKTVEIFHWEEYNPEFNVDEDDLDGDPIADAIYKKNLYTEEKLNVELNFTAVPGDGGNMKPFCDALANRIKDPTTPVDIVSAYGRTTGLAATSGLLQDLTALENLDLSKEWWPKYIYDELELDGRLFFTTGDISTNLLLMMYGVYYNRAYIDAYGLENPADLVVEDEWTVDKFLEMTVGVYDDRDAESGPSGGDFYGVVGAYWDLDPMYHAAGYDLVVKDPTGDVIIKWADELFTDVVGSYVAKLAQWVRKDDVALETKNVHNNAFNDGRSIFNINAASAGFTLRDTEINYGVAPMPKLDPKTQKSFVTCLANPYSLYGICRTSIDPEMAAATMQVLGYYAMLYTTPAVFEVTLKGKWSKEEETLLMWDYMREGISFDLGRIYHTQLQAPADFVSTAIANGTEWSTLVSPSKFARRQGLMDKLNRDIEELIG